MNMISADIVAGNNGNGESHRLVKPEIGAFCFPVTGHEALSGFQMVEHGIRIADFKWIGRAVVAFTGF